MKRIAFFTALVALCFAANAQTLQVQSAMSDLKRGYLPKAKQAIDKACQHEDTKNDAKTWYYAGLIYSRIGGESTKAKSKYKDLDPDWCSKAYNAALRCKELDKGNEYAKENGDIFRFVGSSLYGQSIDAYNSGDYKGALKLCDDAIKMFNNCGDAESTNESYYIAGLCCNAMKDNEGVKKYFSPLVRKTKFKPAFAQKMPRVYNMMYTIYIDAKDTANVLKTAERYSKAFPTDPNASLLLAAAYIWTGNSEKGISLADKAVQSVKDSASLYPVILCAAAGIYENAGNYEGAEAMYKESATLMPNQVAANYGLGIMLYNRAVDKIEAMDKIFESGKDDEVLINKLTEEYKGYFNQAIPHFQQAIKYIDSLDEHQQAMNRPNLYNCLRALNTCYVRLDMLNEAKPIKARLDTFQSGN